MSNSKLENSSLIKLHKAHIKKTGYKKIVSDITILLCHLTNEVMILDLFTSEKVYINTRILKHLYDSKPAEEYEFILYYLNQVIRYPDEIYRNLSSKRGDIAFVKEIKGNRYFSSLEVSKEGGGLIFVVTAFRIRKESYLKNYRLLWSWKGDKPSS